MSYNTFFEMLEHHELVKESAAKPKAKPKAKAEATRTSSVRIKPKPAKVKKTFMKTKFGKGVLAVGTLAGLGFATKKISTYADKQKQKQTQRKF
jgi:hypothetical protein